MMPEEPLSMHRTTRFRTAHLVSLFLVSGGAFGGACSHNTETPTGNGGGTSTPSPSGGQTTTTPQGGASGTSVTPPTAGTSNGGQAPVAGTTGVGGTVTTQGGASPGGADGTGGVMVVEPVAGSGGMPTVEKTSCVDRTLEPGKYTPGYTAPADPRVAQLIGSMTLPQKLAQMQGTTPGQESSKNYDDIQRSPDDMTNNIRGYLYRDGPRGVNLAAKQPGRPDMNNYATAFPVTMARGASWDMDLEYRVGEAMGDETTASQNTMLLGPCMNILRHPAWGRSQETYGEDTYHIGRIATAWTAGLQLHVAGCAKHYAGNNIEDRRDSLNAEMDEQTLREIYGRHFEMVVKDGGVACIMAAYNAVNGVKSTQNKHLLTEVLRNDFGFRGLVLSDWWAMPPGQSFPDTATAQSNAVGAVDAGMDVEVPWNMNYAQLQSVVDAGQLTVSQINTSVSRILEQKFRFKAAVMNEPMGLQTPRTSMAAGSITNNDMHIELARETAVKSMVLIKNEANTLPINKTTVKSIAVLGVDRPYQVRSSTVQPGQGTGTMGTIKFATDMPLGDRGSSRVNADPAKTVGPAAGLTAAAMPLGITVTSGNSADAAANADFIVVMAGLTPQIEGEEYQSPDNGDRKDFALGAGQDELIMAAAALGKPMVVVIEAGANVDMPWLSTVPAVVHAFYAGQAGGTALAQLLFGDANFSGKMPISWPNSWAELPAFNAGNTTVMDYYLGYRWYDKEAKTPLFHFGHGLSYTTFAYSNLIVPCSDVTPGGVMDVTVDVTNTGTVAGEEVAMLFVGYPQEAGIRRSIKELKAFNKVPIMPGQTVRVPLQVRMNDLRYWDMTSNSWKIQPGDMKIMVGPNAGNLPLMDTVKVL
jgi:beta-glucosidase